MYQEPESEEERESEQEREPILPPREQWAELAIRPGSITWERAGDARAFAAAGTALLLQVAHPTVGAGVSEFSNFRADPWGRLFRTLDFTTVLVYGGPEAAAEMGARVRRFHRQIKGTLPDGTPYHSLEPRAYAWVHATLAEAILRAHERFGRPLSLEERRRFWAEWRPLGRFLGVRWRDLPESYEEFREYIARMSSEELERTESVDDVFETLAAPAAPPLRGLPTGAWGAASKPLARFAGLATVGLLPASLQDRLGVHLTAAQEVEFRALGAASRAATPLMPRPLRNFGPAYLKWRRTQIARGDVASPAESPHLDAARRAAEAASA